jgi:hypothetical protein
MVTPGLALTPVGERPRSSPEEHRYRLCGCSRLNFSTRWSLGFSSPWPVCEPIQRRRVAARRGRSSRCVPGRAAQCATRCGFRQHVCSSALDRRRPLVDRPFGQRTQLRSWRLQLCREVGRQLRGKLDGPREHLRRHRPASTRSVEAASGRRSASATTDARQTRRG